MNTFRRTTVLLPGLVMLSSLAWGTPADAANNCPTHTQAVSTTTCILSNPTAPPAVVEHAVRAIAAAKAKRAGWQWKCVELGTSTNSISYDCELFTPDPIGATNTTVNGVLTTVDLHSSVSVAHNGCVYSTKIGQDPGNPAIIANGCGAAGLARIKTAAAAVG